MFMASMPLVASATAAAPPLLTAAAAAVADAATAPAAGLAGDMLWRNNTARHTRQPQLCFAVTRRQHTLGTHLDARRKLRRWRRHPPLPPPHPPRPARRSARRCRPPDRVRRPQLAVGRGRALPRLGSAGFRCSCRTSRRKQCCASRRCDQHDHRAPMGAWPAAAAQLAAVVRPAAHHPFTRHPACQACCHRVRPTNVCPA